MRQLMPAATRLAQDLDHPVHGFFYLALGVEQQYPLLTADRRFQTKVRKHPYLGDRAVDGVLRPFLRPGSSRLAFACHDCSGPLVAGDVRNAENREASPDRHS